MARNSLEADGQAIYIDEAGNELFRVAPIFWPYCLPYNDPSGYGGPLEIDGKLWRSIGYSGEPPKIFVTLQPYAPAIYATSPARVAGPAIP
jgi:hypothetical protein